MHHGDLDARDLRLEPLVGAPRGQVGAVRVPPHRQHGGVGRQPVEQGRIGDVAGVQDDVARAQVRPQTRGQLGPESGHVGVGQDERGGGGHVRRRCTRSR